MTSKKTKIILLLGIIILVSVPMFLKKEKSSITLLEVNNGTDIKTSLIPIKCGEVVYIKCIFKNAGILHNTFEQHGISSIVGYLLFNKINGLSKVETKEKIRNLGISNLIVNPTGDNFEFSFFVLKDNIKDALLFISNAFKKPTISCADLEYAKSIFPKISDPEFSSPYILMTDKMLEMLYPNSTYGMNNTGTSQAIRSITVDNVVSFITQKLHHKNLHVIVTGNVSRFDISTYVDYLFGSIAKTGEEISSQVLPSALSENKSEIIHNADMEDIIGITTGIRIDKLSNKERAAAYIIIASLFQETFGDFQKGLRKLGITYNMNCNFITRSLSNIFYLTVFLKKDDLEKYAKYLNEKINQYYSKINPKDLNIFKKFFIEKSNNGFTHLQDIDEQIYNTTLPFEEITPKILKNVATLMFDQTHIRTVIYRNKEK